MTLTINVLGFELARFQLDIEQSEPASTTVVDKGIKTMSRWWVGRMVGK